ncbi:MAG: ComF family protein [Demequinaceae bacterium]|nr:ComF family protein [Demequinaceae bacterium]
MADSEEAWQRWPMRVAGLAARDIARMIVPVACPGCGARDVRWCEDCAAAWWEPPLRSESMAPRLDIEGRPALPVWAIAELVGQNHSMIVAWKDGGRRDLDRFFADAARRAAEQIAPAIYQGICVKTGGQVDVVGPAPLAVVPVPARAASTRTRGIDLPLLLATAAAEGLRAAGVDATVRRLLGIGKAEQRGASARQRWRQASSLHATKSEGPPAVALLVDDVVTTGATLAAAVRSLDVTFLTVGAGLCLAAAPPSGVTAQGALS